MKINYLNGQKMKTDSLQTENSPVALDSRAKVEGEFLDALNETADRQDVPEVEPEDASKLEQVSHVNEEQEKLSKLAQELTDSLATDDVLFMVNKSIELYKNLGRDQNTGAVILFPQEFSELPVFFSNLWKVLEISYTAISAVVKNPKIVTALAWIATTPNKIQFTLMVISNIITTKRFQNKDWSQLREFISHVLPKSFEYKDELIKALPEIITSLSTNHELIAQLYALSQAGIKALPEIITSLSTNHELIAQLDALSQAGHVLSKESITVAIKILCSKDMMAVFDSIKPMLSTVLFKNRDLLGKILEGFHGKEDAILKILNDDNNEFRENLATIYAQIAKVVPAESPESTRIPGLFFDVHLSPDLAKVALSALKAPSTLASLEEIKDPVNTALKFFTAYEHTSEKVDIVDFITFYQTNNTQFLQDLLQDQDNCKDLESALNKIQDPQQFLGAVADCLSLMLKIESVEDRKIFLGLIKSASKTFATSSLEYFQVDEPIWNLIEGLTEDTKNISALQDLLGALNSESHIIIDKITALLSQTKVITALKDPAIRKSVEGLIFALLNGDRSFYSSILYAFRWVSLSSILQSVSEKPESINSILDSIKKFLSSNSNISFIADTKQWSSGALGALGLFSTVLFKDVKNIGITDYKKQAGDVVWGICIDETAAEARTIRIPLATFLSKQSFDLYKKGELSQLQSEYIQTNMLSNYSTTQNLVLERFHVYCMSIENVIAQKLKFHDCLLEKATIDCHSQVLFNKSDIKDCTINVEMKEIIFSGCKIDNLNIKLKDPTKCNITFKQCTIDEKTLAEIKTLKEKGANIIFKPDKTVTVHPTPPALTAIPSTQNRPRIEPSSMKDAVKSFEPERAAQVQQASPS